MARGRFISNKIAIDRKVHELSSDTCRLAYTWSITFADREGRIIGEPEMLLALVFPRRRDITIETIQSYIDEWVRAEFIYIYLNGDGDKVIQFINFEKNQVGLRKDKEPESVYDHPDNCRIIVGNVPDKLPSNRIEDNVNGNGIEDESTAAVYSAYSNNIGMLSGVISEKIDADIKEYTAKWVIEAIEKATVQEKRSLGYVEGILKGWKRDGKGTPKPEKSNKRTIKIDGQEIEVGMP